MKFLENQFSSKLDFVLYSEYMESFSSKRLEIKNKGEKDKDTM